MKGPPLDSCNDAFHTEITNRQQLLDHLVLSGLVEVLLFLQVRSSFYNVLINARYNSSNLRRRSHRWNIMRSNWRTVRNSLQKIFRFNPQDLLNLYLHHCNPSNLVTHSSHQAIHQPHRPKKRSVIQNGASQHSLVLSCTQRGGGQPPHSLVIRCFALRGGNLNTRLGSVVVCRIK